MIFIRKYLLIFRGALPQFSYSSLYHAMWRDTMTGLCDLYQDFVPFLQQITEKAADGLIARPRRS
jgi:hypothetical protein